MPSFRASCTVPILLLVLQAGCSKEPLTPEQVVQRGAELYQRQGCAACHETGVAPDLRGAWGQDVELTDGRTVEFDSDYIRIALVQPTADYRQGYAPQDAARIMSSYRHLGEDRIDALVAYVRKLSGGPIEADP
jgi:cytochrome c oxidase subunit 2